jgi:hypothetical protein
MSTIDQNLPPQIKPIERAAELAKRNEVGAAVAIRDLVELARALDKLCVSYRIGGRTNERVLDTISKHRWMIS